MELAVSVTDLEKEAMVAGVGGRMRGRDDQGVWGGHVHTAIFKMIPNKDLLYMELCSVLCGSLDGRGVWGRMDTCICMAESLCCRPEIIAIC